MLPIVAGMIGVHYLTSPTHPNPLRWGLVNVFAQVTTILLISASFEAWDESFIPSHHIQLLVEMRVSQTFA
jgi:hypothetical protein